MLQRHSSADVSIGYLLILLPGFALWVAYGISSSNIALVIPAYVLSPGHRCLAQLRTDTGRGVTKRS